MQPKRPKDEIAFTGEHGDWFQKFGKPMCQSISKLFRRKRPLNTRQTLAARFIRGSGIEIGALHNPLWISRKAHVIYVDRLEENKLREHYPELNELPLVKVDVVDDGEKLSVFEMESQDFIIANHFLEHTEDPIGTIFRHLEVLRPGGILYMAVPDKRYTFDKTRPETNFAHLLRDRNEGPEWSNEAHFREFASAVLGSKEQDIESTASGLKATNYSIHFHVWSETSLHDFISRLIIDLHFPMKLESFVANLPDAENICIIRKQNKSLLARIKQLF